MTYIFIFSIFLLNFIYLLRDKWNIDCYIETKHKEQNADYAHLY